MVDTTALPINQQVNLLNDALMVYDVVASNSLVSQGPLIVDGLATFKGGTSGASAVQTVTAATLAPTAAQSGTKYMLNVLTGTTVTLPAPVVGLTYSFYSILAPTSNAYKVITSAGSVFLTGGIFTDKTLTITRYDADGSTILSLNWNGTTTGGIVGSYATFTCISATEWLVEGVQVASGTLATPFATS